MKTDYDILHDDYNILPERAPLDGTAAQRLNTISTFFRETAEERPHLAPMLLPVAASVSQLRRLCEEECGPAAMAAARLDLVGKTRQAVEGVDASDRETVLENIHIARKLFGDAGTSPLPERPRPAPPADDDFSVEKVRAALPGLTNLFTSRARENPVIEDRVTPIIRALGQLGRAFESSDKAGIGAANAAWRESMMAAGASQGPGGALLRNTLRDAAILVARTKPSRR